MSQHVSQLFAEVFQKEWKAVFWVESPLGPKHRFIPPPQQLVARLDAFLEKWSQSIDDAGSLMTEKLQNAIFNQRQLVVKSMLSGKLFLVTIVTMLCSTKIQAWSLCLLPNG